jgi:recombinational DNA repair protein (RecF pathway)
MFRLILLTAQEIERTSEWLLPLSYFAFWTVRLGGWLPRFDRCAVCATPFGAKATYYANWEPGLLCDQCRRSGMFALHPAARTLAERFTGERLDRITLDEAMKASLRELREASLGWVEHHAERKLGTRQLLEKS